MATIDYDHHLHTGARWLVPMLALVLALMAGLVFALVAPHLSLAGRL